MDEEGEKMLGSFSGSGGMIMMGGREPAGYGEWWSQVRNAAEERGEQEIMPWEETR